MFDVLWFWRSKLHFGRPCSTDSQHLQRKHRVRLEMDILPRE